MTDQTAPHPHAMRFSERASAREVIQRILVVVDPTARTHPCVEKAARLAASFGSTIELFICDAEMQIPDSWAGGTTSAQYRQFMREQRIAMLEALATRLRALGLHVITESAWHAPLEEGIVRHSIRSRADLVIKDTHRHPLMSHMPGVQTDWILIKQVPAPLLLVRPTPWPAHPRIAISVDPCHVADRPVALDEVLLARGSAIGCALAGRIEVLHALQPMPHLPGEVPSEESSREFESHERALVERLAQAAQIQRKSIHFMNGSVPEGIVALVAREKPDIAVIGAVGRSRFQNTAATTASQVLEQVESDLLVVKPPGFVSPALVTDR